jgi:hypothetical protein
MYRASVLALLCVVGWPAFGEQPDLTGIQLTPFVGYTVGGEVDATSGSEQTETFRLKESGNFGFVVNGPSKSPTEWEIYFNHQDTAFTKGGPSITLDTLQLGGTYLGRGTRAIPFFVATLGGLRAKVQGSDTDYFVAFTVGGGYKFFPTKRVGLRLEARAVSTVISSNSSWFCGVDGGATCVVRTSGNLLWEAQANAGVIFRF